MFHICEVFSRCQLSALIAILGFDFQALPTWKRSGGKIPISSLQIVSPRHGSSSLWTISYGGIPEEL
jgi:hypothetical protein